MPRSTLRQLLRHLPVLLPLLILLWTGVRGLEFGHHWDERHYQVGPVETMVRTGRFLPQFYGYPSFNYWISAASLATDAIAAGARGERVRDRLLATIATHDYLLRLRAVYLVLSALAVLWVYLAVLSWRNSMPEAMLAAALIAFSWEVAYHIRWVATDGVLMQFGALTLLLLVLAQTRPQGERWLFPAAIAAGLGAGTKYPGGLLLVPVLIAGGLLWKGRVGLRGCVYRLAGLCGLAGLAFVLSTPAVVLDTSALIEGIRYEIAHYGGGHAGHSVRRGPQHALAMADYLGLAVFSCYTPIAAAVAAFAAVGVWSLRKRPRLAVVLLSFPVLYLLYFATQKAMVVRNLLVVVPFLAVFAARGAAWLAAWLEAAARRNGHPSLRLVWLRYGLLAALGFALAVNASWLWFTAATIQQRQTARFVNDAIAFVQARPQTVFYLSPRVAAHFAVLGATDLPNTTNRPRDAERVLFYAQEAMPRWQDWPANRRRLTERWFGPHEVNFNIYPNWWGDDRIVLMSTATAADLDLLILTTEQR